MPIETLNPDVWKLVGHLDGMWTGNGGENYGWGSVPTKNQTLTAAAILGVYKLQQGDQSQLKDYYLVVATPITAFRDLPPTRPPTGFR